MLNCDGRITNLLGRVGGRDNLPPRAVMTPCYFRVANDAYKTLSLQQHNEATSLVPGVIVIWKDANAEWKCGVLGGYTLAACESVGAHAGVCGFRW